MQIDSVPNKNITLTALPVKDVKVRRFFILADGKRSWREIFRMCKVDDEQGMSLAKELVDGGYLSPGVGGSDEPAAVEAELDPDSPLVPTADFVATLSSELANYVGPVAGILVNKLSLPEKLISKGQVDSILPALAMEIDDEAEKKQFLANMAAIF